MINVEKYETYKIPLTIAINFISSKDTNEEGTRHSKINNKKVRLMIIQM